MKMNSTFWAISNIPQETLLRKEFEETKLGRWYFYSSISIEYKDDLGIIIDGYVMPRIAYNQEYANSFNADLVNKAYKKHGSKFVEHVKGMFTIVILEGDSVKVFSDRSGMGKYFTYAEDADYLVTNNLEVIAQNYKLGVSNEGIALYTLMEHYIDRNTMFKNVLFSCPASRLILTDTVKEDQYWNRAVLQSLKKKKYGFESMAFHYRDILKGYIDCFTPSNITMTLTGGNDSRAILAGLLNIGVKPRTFTFGNPESYDGVVAYRIAKQENLEFSNYYQSNPTVEWFRSKANEIIEMGNSLINIHRAHRLDAIQCEVAKYPETDMIFCGFMGGDYIKGINYDDYITAKILHLNEYSQESFEENIDIIAEENFLVIEKFERSMIEKQLASQTYFSEKEKIDREFSYVFDVVGCMHDFQDTYIFAKHIPVVVNIYMDIDFLEILFSSQFSMMQKDNSAQNQLKRMNQPELHCNIINILTPSLSSIEFAKHYSPEEFLGNKLIYLVKRIYRNYFGKKYPESFPYGNWLYDYVTSMLSRLETEIACLYDTDLGMSALENEECITMEKYWHRYTNMINVSENLKFYRNSFKQE